jgi:multicomponent Na+:H+ antiporter subunit D
MQALSVIFQAGLLAASVWLLIQTREAEVVFNIGDYESLLGIVLRADSLSAVFVFLTSFIFLAIFIFTYKDKREQYMFRFLLFVLEAALIGLFLTGDFFNIFVLVEVSTLVIVILTMYDRERRNVFYGKVFLLLNIVAIQFFLLGLGYLYRLTGVLSIEAATEILRTVDKSDLVLPYTLIMTAIAFKCSLIPFFSWLPKVRLYPGAPSGVAAILSGLQIKSAIYIYICFSDMFAPVAAPEFFLVLGIIMGLFGAVLAFSQTDIKMMLAYSTISQVGLIIIGLSSGCDYSRIGALYHIVNHAVFKTTLFLCASIIVRVYGTADITLIRGVFRRMPAVSVAAFLAILGITGAPFWGGSISKYFITYDMPVWLYTVVIALSLCTIVYYYKFSTMFTTRQGDTRQGDGSSVLEATRQGDGSSVLETKIDTRQMNRPPVLCPVLIEKCWVVPTLLLGITCLVCGVLGTQIMAFFFRYPVSVNAFDYFQKAMIFCTSVAAGFWIFKYADRLRLLKSLGGLRVGFKTLCGSLLVFFIVITLYVGYLGM